MGLEFRINFEPLFNMNQCCVGDVDRKEGEERLAVCADGKTSIDPAMPRKVMGGMNH